MIQEEMVFALGFFTAGLLALACLPAVWRRALRLTKRRLTQLVPLSMDEIVAERDQLRAGFAVSQRRLEQKLEQLETSRSVTLAEVGRRDAQVARLDEDLARERARVESLTQDLDATRRELFGLRAETGAAAIALYDSEGLAEKRRWEVIEAEENGRALRNTVDEGRAAIAAFETRILGLEARVEDLNQELAKTRAELGRSVESVTRTAGERDGARKAAESIASKRDGLQLEVDRLTLEMAELKAALEQRSGVVQSAEDRVSALTQTIATHQTRMHELTAEKQRLEAGFDERLEAVRSEAAAAAAMIEELRAEKAALSGALASARQAPSEPPLDKVASEDDLASLRAAITKVGDDVLRMTETARAAASRGPERGEQQPGSSALLSAE